MAFERDGSDSLILSIIVEKSAEAVEAMGK